MRQAYRILPVYSGDVSGVCSALYELGGMVVMHDPSGCNSTYNTHDETRWYDRDSLIFLSGLCEPDAIMGNDGKLIDDVVRAAETFRPAFIALCNSPIPYLNGTDFAGICRIIEHRTGIPAFYIPTNGMHDYINGAGMAFERLARKLFDQQTTEQTTSEVVSRSVNILGLTPLDYAKESCTASLRAILEKGGWTIRSVWAMGDSLADLRRAGEAAVNLVVSASGLRVAEYLRERFGTPWIAGAPVGSMKNAVLRRLDEASENGQCGLAYETDGHETDRQEDGGKPGVIAIGEPVLSCSIAADFGSKGIEAKVIAATQESERLIRRGDLLCAGEEEVENALESLSREGTRIIADPLYRYVLPEGAILEPLPHLAFSGRIYRSSFSDPFAGAGIEALHAGA